MERLRMTLVSAIAMALGSFAASDPARAEWSQVAAVPSVNLYSVWADGDTLAAGSDSTVFVSFDAGATWTMTAKVAAGVTMVQAVRVHGARLYAGTYGQGVFVSSDLGTTWQGFSQGLVGGINNSQLYIMDLLLRGDSLFAATGGAGPWIRNLRTGGPWTHYGSALEPAQAGNMESIAASPTRLLACAGFNGDVFHRDVGSPDWTESLLFNDRLAAGLAPLSAIWTGSSWLVGTNIGVFRSSLGQSPWTYFDFGLHPTFFASFVLHDGLVFAHFASGEGTGIEYSRDDGVTWQVLDALPLTFTYNIASTGDVLYAARVDGLWRRSIANVAVPPETPSSLGFALAGSNPIQGVVRFRVDVPTGGRVRIGLFDLMGRRMAGGIDQSLPAGTHELMWNEETVPAGIYLARLEAVGRSKVLRFVHLR